MSMPALKDFEKGLYSSANFAIQLVQPTARNKILLEREDALSSARRISYSQQPLDCETQGVWRCVLQKKSDMHHAEKNFQAAVAPDRLFVYSCARLLFRPVHVCLYLNIGSGG